MTSKLISHLKHRTDKQGMSNLIIIIGKKGSGKSYLSLRLGEIIEGSGFNMAHVCFSLKQLFELLTSGKYKPGDVVILEEIGIAANARDAMTRMNKHLSFVAQAIRPARINLLVNTISWGLIDNQVRNMADYRIEVIGHDVLTGLTDFKFLKISPRQDNAEPYKEHLIFNDENGRPVKYISWTIHKPSGKLAEEYENKRMEYLKQIYADGAASSLGNVAIGKKTVKELQPTLGELAERVLTFKDNYMINDKLSSALVAEKFGLGINKAASVVAIAKQRWQNLHTPP